MPESELIPGPAATCPACGVSLAPDAHFCSVCGTDLAEPHRCPSCGAAFPAQARFCASCGVSLAPDAAAPAAPAMADGGSAAPAGASALAALGRQAARLKTMPNAASWGCLALGLIVVALLALSSCCSLLFWALRSGGP